MAFDPSENFGKFNPSVKARKPDPKKLAELLRIKASLSWREGDWDAVLIKNPDGTEKKSWKLWEFSADDISPEAQREYAAELSHLGLNTPHPEWRLDRSDGKIKFIDGNDIHTVKPDV